MMGCGGITECATCQLQDMIRNRRADLEQRFSRKLGKENCWFEAFDLDTQLGVAFTNPATGKRWAVRMRPNCDVAEVDALVRRLREMTEAMQ